MKIQLIIIFIVISVTRNNIINAIIRTNTQTLRYSFIYSNRTQSSLQNDLSTGKRITKTNLSTSKPWPIYNCNNCPFGSVCNYTIKKCQCDDELIYINGKCRGSSLFGYCESDYSCRFEAAGSECVNNRCACQRDYPVNYKNKCLEAKTFGESCSITEQCHKGTKNSVCLNSYCKCGKPYKPYSRKWEYVCLKDTKLGDKCIKDEECKGYDVNSICAKPMYWITDGVCKCKTSHEQYGNYCSQTESTVHWFVRIGIGLGSALLAAIVALIIAIISRKVFTSLRLAQLQRTRDMIHQEYAANIQASDTLPKYEDIVTIKDVESAPPSYAEALETLQSRGNISCITVTTDAVHTTR